MRLTMRHIKSENSNIHNCFQPFMLEDSRPSLCFAIKTQKTQQTLGFLQTVLQGGVD